MIRGLEPGRKPALLISECQRGVIEHGMTDFPGLADQVAERGIVVRIAALAQHFRNNGFAVIHLHVAHRPDYADLPKTSLIVARTVKNQRMRLGTAEADSVAGLAPQPTDIVHSRTFSLLGFNGTNLDAMLRHLGIQTLVLAGVSTNIAINGLAVCGSDLGYQVVVPEDCTAGASAETHQFMVANALPLYSTVTDSAAVTQSLNGRQTPS